MITRFAASSVRASLAVSLQVQPQAGARICQEFLDLESGRQSLLPHLLLVLHSLLLHLQVLLLHCQEAVYVHLESRDFVKKLSTSTWRAETSTKSARMLAH